MKRTDNIVEVERKEKVRTENKKKSQTFQSIGVSNTNTVWAVMALPGTLCRTHIIGVDTLFIKLFLFEGWAFTFHVDKFLFLAS